MNRKLAFFLVTVASLAIVSACGGDDDDAVSFESGGPVICDRLETDSYTYIVDVEFTTESPEPKPTGVRQGPPSGSFTQHIEGQVEDSDSFMGDIVNDDASASRTEYSVVVDNGRSWWNPTGWQEQPSRDGRPGVSVPHLPLTLCQSLAQDIDTSLAAESEEVNGIKSLRFDASPLSTDFPDRSPDGPFGAGSDVAVLVNEFNGAVWVAERGGYINKLELSGTGQYEDGTVLNVSIRYEISEMGADIDVDPPI
jgi:hypothetical protein